jgi:hypothetical protein
MNWPESPSFELSLRSPNLNTFTEYLRSSGWILADEDNRTSLWRPVDGDDKSLVLPVDQSVTDYKDRVYEALRLLAYVEHRSLNEVASDIVSGPADNVIVRLTPDAPSGQAPLALAHEAISALRSYVIGSGAALNDSSLVLPARRSRQVESYAGETRLSTFPGSFILSLALPLMPDARNSEGDLQSSLPGIEEDSRAQDEISDSSSQPFGRRVANRMAAVAMYAQRLAEEVNEGNDRLPSFAQAKANAPNATELEALSGLGGPDRNPYEVRFSQSPLASQRKSPFTLRVTPGQQRVMADAAEYLRTTQSHPNITAEGLVVSLSRNNQYEPGLVTVRAVVDDSGKPRRFHMEVTAEDYNEALQAHTEGLPVVVRGDLETRGTWKWLRNPRGFAIVPDSRYDEDE